MNLDELKQFLVEKGEPKYRIDQIFKAVFKDAVGNFSEISTISKSLRDSISAQFEILSFDVLQINLSKNKDSAKALLKLRDGQLIETVLISPKAGVWSVCVSCQVGCAMGCRFCATGKMGFKRNLTAEEITDQVLFWKQYLNNNLKFQISNLKLTNIVFMGMGEPFLNWQNVSESLKILIDEKIFGFGSRSISVSTSGITEGMEKLANEFPQVNLAISLHFATDQQRDSFMPVNKKDNLENLKFALQKYFQKTKRKVFIEYILLESLNDRFIDAQNLADYLKSIGSLHLLHVNLIRYNTTSDIFMSSTRKRTQAFKDKLSELGINATIRKSLGEEIQGACGQLAG